MVINLDFSGLQELLTLPMETALWRIFFWYFGWLPIAIIMLWGLIQLWLFERRSSWEHHQKFILLAIDVPRNNEQSLMAVENLLTYLAGGHGTYTLIEKWWHGKIQLAFSLEIISIGGYIQFLVHTPAHFKNLIESAVYSQYPDAEIYEVEDYTKMAPNKFPDEDYDIFGTEFIQVAHEILPIKTYPQFEHDFGESNTKFRDPMTSLMDLMSSLRKGEQLWYQIILVPISTSWTAEAQHYIDEKLGKGHPVTRANSIADSLVKALGALSEMIYSLWGEIDEHDKKDAKTALKFPELDPLAKAQIEGAHRKMGKMGFEVCIRMVYLSRKEVMNKPKVVNGFVGYIKQFNTNDLNALKPDTKLTMTSASYFFTKGRINHKKNSIMQGYKHRSDLIGHKPWVMNVEEIASLWHFPLDAVTKAPLIQRSAGKKIEPPISLPIDEGKKTGSSLDPIFDEGFKVMEDETGQDEETTETEAVIVKKTHSGKPAFFDDDTEAEVSVAENLVPNKKIRGEAPVNLPFE
ncbi:MAG TPA: hypothetical protein PK720_03245 [bacterium]|jgi:hypothetical protein|nr:hypothetical protein [bacterium]